MTLYITKCGVYFEKDLIRTKLLGLSKTTLMAAKREFCVLKLKNPKFIVWNIHSFLFNGYIYKKTIEMLFLLAMMALCKFFWVHDLAQALTCKSKNFRRTDACNIRFRKIFGSV